MMIEQDPEAGMTADGPATATERDDLPVPNRHLPHFLIATNLRIMGLAEPVGTSLALDFTHDQRLVDDRRMRQLITAIGHREALLRALDDKQPVPFAVLRDYADDTLSHVLERVLAAAEETPPILAEIAEELRDLAEWTDAHGITTGASATTSWGPSS
jgi:hypothetical protein